MDTYHNIQENEKSPVIIEFMQLQFFFLHSIPTFEKMAYSGIEK